MNQYDFWVLMMPFPSSPNAHERIHVIKTRFIEGQSVCFNLLSWEGCAAPQHLAVLAPGCSVGSTNQQARHHLELIRESDLLTQNLHFNRGPGQPTWQWVFLRKTSAYPDPSRADHCAIDLSWPPNLKCPTSHSTFCHPILILQLHPMFVVFFFNLLSDIFLISVLFFSLYNLC